jgi:hypothetical protein
MTTASSSPKFVAIVMSARRAPLLLACTGLTEHDISVANERFTEAPCVDWLGFYDWLRTEIGELVGLRLFLDDPADLNLELFRNLTGVTLDVQAGAKLRNLTVLFTEDVGFHEPHSVNGNFGDNRLFIGDRGSVALTFCAPDETALATGLARYGADARFHDEGRNRG